MSHLVDAEQLSARLRDKRLNQGLSVRLAAKEAGVSAATFSRVERGDHVPGGENLLKLARWAGVALEAGTMGEPSKEVEEDRSSESILDQVTVHLRADKNLSPEDADVLVAVFRTAYESLLKRRAKTE